MKRLVAFVKFFVKLFVFFRRECHETKLTTERFVADMVSAYVNEQIFFVVVRYSTLLTRYPILVQVNEFNVGLQDLILFEFLSACFALERSLIVVSSLVII